MFSLSFLYVTFRDFVLKQSSSQVCLPRALQRPHQAFRIKHKPVAETSGRAFFIRRHISLVFSFTASPGTQNQNNRCITWSICDSENFPPSPIYPPLSTNPPAQNNYPYLSKEALPVQNGILHTDIHWCAGVVCRQTSLSHSHPLGIYPWDETHTRTQRPLLKMSMRPLKKRGPNIHIQDQNYCPSYNTICTTFLVIN